MLSLSKEIGIRLFMMVIAVACMAVVISDGVNLLISILSLFLVLWAIWDIKRVGVKSYNVFTFFYFFPLFISTWKLSIFQTEKEILDIHYYFTGPLFLLLPLAASEKLKKFVSLKIRPLISLELFYVFLLLFYVGVKLYIGSVTGWRIESVLVDDYLVSGSEYTIPGVSGLVAIAQWWLLMLTPYVKKRYVVIAVLAIIIFSGILHVKRGDIMRVLIFLLTWLSYERLKPSYSLSISKLVKIAVIVVASFSVFVYTGNLRQEARGSSTENLASSAGLNSQSSVLNWIYSYVAINYEVVREYFNDTPRYRPDALLFPILGIEEESMGPSHDINGFNASPLTQWFIQDFGFFYFFEMIFFGIMVGVLIWTSRSLDFKGGYIFILSMLALSFFGNLFLIRSILLSIVTSFIVFPFLRRGQAHISSLSS